MNGKPSDKRILGITLLTAAVLVLAALVGGAWLVSSQGCSHTFCPNLDIVGVYPVTLGSNGWVTFNMTGAQAFNHVISAVTAVNESTYPYPQPLGSVSLSSNNVLPAKGNLILSVQFQGVTWQPRVWYAFSILLEGSTRLGITVYQCLSECPYNITRTSVPSTFTL